ncbi:hypothetical protein BGX26_005226, partial [Mortierella sp. AD094]
GPRDALENTPEHWGPRRYGPPPHPEYASFHRERTGRDGRANSLLQSFIPSPQHYTSSQRPHWPEQQPYRKDVDLRYASSQIAAAIPDRQYLPFYPIGPSQDQFLEDNTNRLRKSRVDHGFELGRLPPALKKARLQEPQFHPSQHRNFGPLALPAPPSQNQTYRQPQLQDHSFVRKGSSSQIGPDKDEVELRGKRTDDSQISLDSQSSGSGYERQIPSDQTRPPLPPLPPSPAPPRYSQLDQTGTEYAQDRDLTRVRSSFLHPVTPTSVKRNDAKQSMFVEHTTEPFRSRHEPAHSFEQNSKRQDFSASSQGITNANDDSESQQTEPNPGTRLHYRESDEMRRLYHIDEDIETNHSRWLEEGPDSTPATLWRKESNTAAFVPTGKPSMAMRNELSLNAPPRDKLDNSLLRESTVGGDSRQNYPREPQQSMPFQRSQSPVDLENVAPSHLSAPPSTPTRLNLIRKQSIPTQRSTNMKPLTLPPIHEPIATNPAIHGLRGGDASDGRTNSTGSSSMVSAAPTFQDTRESSPRSGLSWQLGHAGYYYKEDLGKLYDLWRSQYVSNGSSPLPTLQTGSKEGSVEGSMESERTRDSAEEWGSTSNKSIDKGKGVWQDMDTKPSFVGRDDAYSREEGSMRNARYSSPEIMSARDIEDGTAGWDLPARSSDNNEAKIA